MIKNGIVFVFLVFLATQLKAQDTTKQSTFTLNTDLVSRYVWRGLLYSAAPNIQPYASFTKGQLTFGTWGSYAIGEKYAEVDFYILWQLKNFGFSLNDYCSLSEPAENTEYFTFKNTKTPHVLEGTLTYQFSEGFPLKLTAATFFYGNDRDSTGNLYSTYFELSYPFSYTGYNFNVYAGGTPSKGLYGTKAGLVNIGASAKKTLKLSESFDLPVSVQLTANPLSNYIFLVFVITI